MWSGTGALGAPAALQNGVGASHRKVLLASKVFVLEIQNELC